MQMSVAREIGSELTTGHWHSLTYDRARRRSKLLVEYVVMKFDGLFDYDNPPLSRARITALSRSRSFAN